MTKFLKKHYQLVILIKNLDLDFSKEILIELDFQNVKIPIFIYSILKREYISPNIDFLGNRQIRFDLSSN